MASTPSTIAQHAPTQLEFIQAFQNSPAYQNLLQRMDPEFVQAFRAFQNSPAYQNFLNNISHKNDMDIQVFAWHYNVAIKEFKCSKEGKPYEDTLFEIPPSSFEASFDSSAESSTESDRFIGPELNPAPELNPSLWLFFLHCCCTVSYGFRCEHPNPDPSMSLCTSFPPNPLDPYGNNIVFTRTAVQNYYPAVTILMLCCITIGATTISLPSSMLSFAARTLYQTLPVLTGPHFFALTEAAYRRWQSDTKKILEQYSPQDGPSPITMSEEDGHRPGNSSPMRR